MELKTKIRLGYAIILSFVMAIGLIVFFNSKSFQSKIDRVVNIDKVLRKAELLREVALDLETQERSFLITGKQKYLDSFNNLMITFRRLLIEERALLHEESESRPKLKKIELAFDSWVKNAATPIIELRKQHDKGITGYSPILEQINSEVEESSTKELHTILDDFVDIESSLHVSFIGDARELISYTEFLVSILSVFTVIFGAIVAYFFPREIPDSPKYK
ncbi:MAG: CHASE3 domain sensor protein [Chlamydiales bacterium]|jgi:CHASE3 domain sensor protein